MLSSQRPEVSRLWINRRFGAWSGSDSWWTDLATRTVRSPVEGAPSLPVVPEGVEGVVHVPPVARALEQDRRRLVDDLTAKGATVLVQLHPGDEAIEASKVHCVYDLLPTILQGRLDALRELARFAAVVWPLIPGLSDAPSLWQEGCRLLSGAGISCVQAVTPTLDGRERRMLASELEGGDPTLFESIFHGRPPTERAFARIANHFGLSPFFARPLEYDRGRQARNRRVAELLSVAAEVWLSLDRTESIAQNLFRTARWAEETSIDVRALALEDNLEILEWLLEPASSMVREWAELGSSPTLEALVKEYVS